MSSIEITGVRNIIKRKDNHTVITIFLGKRDPLVMRDLHCTTCGGIIMNYYNELRLIVPGEEVEVEKHSYSTILYVTSQ